MFNNITITKVIAGQYIATSVHTGESAEISAIKAFGVTSWSFKPRNARSVTDHGDVIKDNYPRYVGSFKEAKAKAEKYFDPETNRFWV